jgi:hypothetical protein
VLGYGPYCTSGNTEVWIRHQWARPQTPSLPPESMLLKDLQCPSLAFPFLGNGIPSWSPWLAWNWRQGVGAKPRAAPCSHQNLSWPAVSQNWSYTWAPCSISTKDMEKPTRCWVTLYTRVPLSSASERKILRTTGNHCRWYPWYTSQQDTEARQEGKQGQS